MFTSHTKFKTGIWKGGGIVVPVDQHAHDHTLCVMFLTILQQLGDKTGYDFCHSHYVLKYKKAKL